MAGNHLNLQAALLQLCQLTNEEELLHARMAVKLHATDMAFSILNQTKVITAASELGRNVIEHGFGGTVRIDRVSTEERIGLRLTFKDSGPGISNLSLALEGGNSTKKGMGLGLSGSQRLMDDFDIATAPQVGTTIVAIKWK